MKPLLELRSRQLLRMALDAGGKVWGLFVVMGIGSCLPCCRCLFERDVVFLEKDDELVRGRGMKSRTEHRALLSREKCLFLFSPGTGENRA